MIFESFPHPISVLRALSCFNFFNLAGRAFQNLYFFFGLKLQLMKLLFSPSLLVVTLSLFSIILVVNSAPVNLEVNLNPREAEADLTVCSKTIKLRDNKYASICKDPTNPRPGVVQVAGPGQYQWADSAQMSIALTKPFNLGKPTKNGYKTLIQCDHCEFKFVCNLCHKPSRGVKLTVSHSCHL